MQAYLVHLAGQGDVDIKLVSKTTWDLMIDRVMPPAEYIQEFKTPELFQEFMVDLPDLMANSGSYDNDIALRSPAICAAGVTARFSSVRELVQFAKTNNIDIVDEFEGFIY